MRVLRYIRSIRALGRIAWNRHNLRALWLQSDPHCWDKRTWPDLTDDEWEAWEREMEVL